MRKMKFSGGMILVALAALPLAHCGRSDEASRVVPAVGGEAGTETGTDAAGGVPNAPIAPVAPVAAKPTLPAGVTLVSAPLPTDPMGVSIYKLGNGMSVMLSENHETPRLDAWITVRAGSAKDPADATGMAHYLEHMQFKGTDRLGTLNWEAEKPHLDRIVFRSTLPERVFGSRFTTIASRKLATGPTCARTNCTSSATITSCARATPDLSTTNPSGSCVLRASRTPMTAHSATSG